MRGLLEAGAMLAAESIQTSVFGSTQERTRRPAIRQVVANMRTKKFNCPELAQVAAKRFLGWP